MISEQRIRLILSYFFIILLSSCSNDEVVDVESNQEIKVTMIGEDLENIYQFDYQRNLDEGIQTNLSTELGITNNYLTLRQFDNTLSFYSFSNNAISLAQKNLTSGKVSTFLELHDITSEHSLVWGINDVNSVYFGLYKPVGSTNLTLRTVSLTNFTGVDMSLEYGIDQLLEPLHSNGKLFITYVSAEGDYKIVVFDTDKNSIIKTFEFGDVKPSILINDDGNLAIFTQNNNENTFLEIFDGANLLSLSKTELNFDLPFSAGPINASLIGHKLYYQFSYPQPFQIEKGPAIFNISTSENTILDILGLINNLNKEYELSIRPFTGRYLSYVNLFAVSYGLQNAKDMEIGGFMLISLDGNLVAQKNLNFIPTYFVD